MTVTASWDDDPAQHDPFLICQECGEKLCSIEEGDDFDVLARVVAEHECPPKMVEASFEGVHVMLTHSAGADDALLLMIDTNDSVPEGPQGPEIRVLLNDEPVFVGKDYEPLESVELLEPLENADLHEVKLLLDPSEQPRTVHELARVLLTWTDGPLALRPLEP